MLKRVQHDREKGDGVRYRLIEGTIRSLQDDKERGLRVGRMVYACHFRGVADWDCKVRWFGGSGGLLDQYL